MTLIEGCHEVGMATITEDTQELTPAAAFRNKYLQETQDSILFEPKSNIEPKIILQQENTSTLLSKLSAPVKAKLSRSKSKEPYY